VLTFTTFARAEDHTAEALFRAGKQAAQAGDYKTACEKFEQSEQLEPAPGTLLNLADCEEHLGRLGLASQHFRLAAQQFRANDTRVGYAKQRAATAESHMARLVIRLSARAPAQTKILRDGVELDPAALGQPLRVDPGEHLVIARAADKSDRRDATYPITLLQGETKELSVDPADAPSVAVVAPEPIPVSKGPISKAPVSNVPIEPSPSAKDASAKSRLPPDLPRETHVESGPSRALGWVSLGIGGAGFAVGAIFGLQAISKKSTIDSHCNATCDLEGYDAQSSFKSDSLLSTIGFGAALLGVGAGTYFLVARPFDKRITVAARPEHAGLALHVTAEF